ncbi:MAG TPA: septum formation family protein, partial [Galbitalea sp.]
PAEPAAIPTPPALVMPPPAAPPLVMPPPAAPALVSPPTEPYVAPPTQPYVSEPTKPLSWDEFASTQQPLVPGVPPAEQPTEAYTVQPWQPAAASSPVAPATAALPAEPGEPTSAIDSLFGDHQFQDYEEVGVLQTIQVSPTSTMPGEPELRAPREPLPTSQKALMGAAAGLIAVLILIGSFFLGEHLGSAAAATPAAKRSSGPSSIPTSAGTGGPVAPGVQPWTALQGGECIQPFSSAWAVTFTVVSCTADHDAQMVFKGKLPDTSATKYPTAAEFQQEITPLCSDSTAINYTAAAAVTDLQVSYSYPPTTASWLAGNRTYYCFIDRVSGGNLPGDLSVPKTH